VTWIFNLKTKKQPGTSISAKINTVNAGIKEPLNFGSRLLCFLRISRNEGNKYSSFQMTVESHHTRVIATLSDWLKKFRQFINQWEAKPMAPCTRDFSRALSKWKVIFRNLIGSFWGCSEWRLLWFSFLRQPFQNRSYNVMSCLMLRTILEKSWNYFFL